MVDLVGAIRKSLLPQRGSDALGVGLGPAVLGAPLQQGVDREAGAVAAPGLGVRVRLLAGRGTGSHRRVASRDAEDPLGVEAVAARLVVGQRRVGEGAGGSGGHLRPAERGRFLHRGRLGLRRRALARAASPRPPARER